MDRMIFSYLDEDRMIFCYLDSQIENKQIDRKQIDIKIDRQLDSWIDRYENKQKIDRFKNSQI